MATKINVISANGNDTITQPISDINPAADEKNIAKFVVALSGLSNNQLKRIEKITASKVYLPYSVIGSEDAETILCNDRYVTIDALGGDDVISLGANAGECTVNAGSGNNTIYSSGDSNLIFASSGDIVFGLSQDDTLRDDGAILSTVLGNCYTAVKVKGQLQLDGSFADLDSDTAFNVQKGDKTAKLKIINDFTLYSGTDNAESLWAYHEGLLILAGAGNDTIDNKKAYPNLIIFGGQGNDKIINAGDYVFIDADESFWTLTTANDTINNTGNHCTIYGGSGADSIVNGDSLDPEVGAYSSIIAGSENDTIYNSGKFVTIEAGTGNDRVYNLGPKSLIKLGLGADIIYNGVAGAGSTILSDSANNSNDTINNAGSDVAIIFYGGADRVTNSGANVTIQTGAGADNIVNTIGGNNCLIIAGDGTDNVTNHGAGCTILTGEGNDNINLQAGATGCSIYSADGNDAITVNASAQATIYTGSVDSVGSKTDLITNNSTLRANVYQFDTNDTINTRVVGFKFGDSIQILNFDSAKDTVTNYIAPIDSATAFTSDYAYLVLNLKGKNEGQGGNVSIDAAEIKPHPNEPALNILDKNGVIISDFKLPKLYVGTSSADTDMKLADSMTDRDGYYFMGLGGNDFIYNDGNFATLDGGAGNDRFANSGTGVLITGMAGNDTVWNYGSNTTIDAGAGNDSIHNYADNVLISLGAGNDTVYLHGDNTVTIYGGQGNDVFFSDRLGKNIYLFAGGEGNNTIRGFNHNSDVIIFTSTTDASLVSAATINGAGNKISVSAGNVSVTAYSTEDSVLPNGDPFNHYFEDNPIVCQLANSETLAPNVTVRALEAREVYDNSGSSYTEIRRIYSKGTASINNVRDNISIQGASGNCTIISNANNVSIMTAGGADKITIGGTANYVSMAGANDTVNVSSGAVNNTIYAGAGNDSIVNNGAGNVFYYAGTGEGNDTITAFGENDSIATGNSDAVITSALNDSDCVVATIAAAGKTTITLPDKKIGDAVKVLVDGQLSSHTLGGD